MTFLVVWCLAILKMIKQKLGNVLFQYSTLELLTMKAYQQPAKNEHIEAALYKLIVDLIRFGSFCLHKGFCRFYHVIFST